MVNYDFYKNVYLGSTISEGVFPRLIARAEDWLARLERCCTVKAPGPESRGMAACAVAEALAEHEKHRFVSQASVGGVSVRYENSLHAMQRQLLGCAGVYLDIYRGVG